MQTTKLARLTCVAGKKTMRLNHYGRNTGKPHKVTIWFALDDDKLYIGTADAPRMTISDGSLRTENHSNE
jgi:hypothetical protein